MKAGGKCLPALEQEQYGDKWQQRGAQLGANPRNQETPLFALINVRLEEGQRERPEEVKEFFQLPNQALPFSALSPPGHYASPLLAFDL